MSTQQSFNHINNGYEPAFVPGPEVHSADEYFVCQRVGPTGMPCWHTIHGHDLSTHYLQVHNIRGSDNMLVHCAWNGCPIVLKKESLCRHVRSAHLLIKYTCDTCNQSFTRKYGLNVHKCPGSQQ
ncbi:hypothetical protein K503DRAFT_178418 [Rhizopogon vinicolor AM-OR11-026]|uniref:C2H2-type domain-containing protein n=1 Tax=Rhizopogon vinicolor AM-OR11-026 TaxID=1314800 RepID=A0A1B7N046_9AGAM|nr:hypothetical protein K503DRAFT_178418 [Rhizopogon vinicolor AM-OR11-026]